MDQLIRNVSELAAIGAPLFSLADLRSRCAANGTSAAVRDHDTAALFDWLADVLSYQGVSDGGKPRLLGITKRGNTYLRTLLIHGARAALPSLVGHHTGPGCDPARRDERRASLLTLSDVMGTGHHAAPRSVTTSVAPNSFASQNALLCHSRSDQSQRDHESFQE
jgi:hypothetical protein